MGNACGSTGGSSSGIAGIGSSASSSGSAGSGSGARSTDGSPDAQGDDVGNPSVDAGADSPATTHPGVDGGVDGSASLYGGGCPQSLPILGSPCSSPWLVCVYGDDPLPRCRDQATCQGNSANEWNVTNGNCAAEGACPDSEPKPGDSCSASAPACQSFLPSCLDVTVCMFGANACVCLNEFGGCGECPPSPNWRWNCAPHPPALCPSVPPNVGTACGAEGTVCTYEPQACTVSCSKGFWKGIDLNNPNIGCAPFCCGG
jgi:hypothetical protein